MANARTRRVALACALALAFWPRTGLAEENGTLLATIDKPAVITAKRHASAAGVPSGRLEVIVSVISYRPSGDGSPVEIVVDGRVEGAADQEIGRFGITPDREFVAADPSDAQRFRFALPHGFAADVGAGKTVAFVVRLVPVLGNGQGASLRVGDVKLP